MALKEGGGVGRKTLENRWYGLPFDYIPAYPGIPMFPAFYIGIIMLIAQTLESGSGWNPSFTTYEL